MLTLHDVIRAVLRADSAVLNDARWVEHAVAAVAAHEAKFPAPAVPDPAAEPAPEPAAAPAPAPAAAPADEIAALQARLAELTGGQAEGTPG